MTERLIAEKWTDPTKGHLFSELDPYAHELIDRESKRQVLKHGYQTVTPERWLMFLTEEVGELARAITEAEYGKADWYPIRAEAVQVATLAIKIAMMAGQ